MRRLIFESLLMVLIIISVSSAAVPAVSAEQHYTSLTYEARLTMNIEATIHILGNQAEVKWDPETRTYRPTPQELEGFNQIKVSGSQKFQFTISEIGGSKVDDLIGKADVPFAWSGTFTPTENTRCKSGSINGETNLSFLFQYSRENGTVDVAAGARGIQSISPPPDTECVGAIDLAMGPLLGSFLKPNPEEAFPVEISENALDFQVREPELLGREGENGVMRGTLELSLVDAKTLDISVSATPASAEVTPGQSAFYTVDITSVNAGPYAGVGIDVSGLPPNTEWTTGEQSLLSLPNGRAEIEIITSPTTPIGTYTLTITVDAALLQSKKITVTLTVGSALSKPFDFKLAIAAEEKKLPIGSTHYLPVTVEVISGEPTPVSLSVSGLPPGTNAEFKAGNSPSTHILAVTSSTATPEGTYQITVTGTGGQVTHSTTFTLTISEMKANEVTPEKPAAPEKTSPSPQPQLIQATQDAQIGQQIVTTGNEGFADLALGESGVVRFGPNTDANWQTSSGEVLLTVVGGKMHLSWKAEPPTESARQTGPGTDEIKGEGLSITGIGITYGDNTARLTGTEVLVEVANDGTGTITVLDGTVEVWKTKDPAKRVRVSGGQQLITYTDSQLPTPTAADARLLSTIPPLSTSIAAITGVEENWWKLPPNERPTPVSDVVIALVTFFGLFIALPVGLGVWAIRRRRRRKARLAGPQPTSTDNPSRS